jgi:uncharacterized membrane protein
MTFTTTTFSRIIFKVWAPWSKHMTDAPPKAEESKTKPEPAKQEPEQKNDAPKQEQKTDVKNQKTDDLQKRRSLIQLLRTEYLIGDLVPGSAIYECSECGTIGAFKQGERFTGCQDCNSPQDVQGWYRTNEFVHFVSKNLNTEFRRIETFSVRLAELIADVAGNIWFVYLHIIWFGVWIYINLGNPLWDVHPFDPFPFGLLTMIVSLEAIFLSTFLLISQNIQGRRSELRAELDYQVNLKTEKDVAEILSILNDIRAGRLQLKENQIIFGEDAKRRRRKTQ